MRRGIPFLLVGLLVVGLAAVSGPEAARGCAPVFPAGATVRIAQESALILWDAASKTEHFLRRASFDTGAADFGFLVPTPTTPTLHEAPDDLFRNLEEWTKPEEIVRTMPAPPGPAGRAANRALPPTAAPVTVLGEQEVAGMNAAILKATDAEALRRWLEKNGYAARPALTAWLDRYVQSGWVVTAFKFARRAGAAGRVAPKAVRLTFQADRPFYPYREPEDARLPGVKGTRLLRVFFVGEHRVDGALGDSEGGWPGKPVWANPLEAGRRDRLLRDLKIADSGLPASPWLTVFEDSSFPRPGTDEVFFAKSPRQDGLKRPPVTRWVYASAGPAGLFGLGTKGPGTGGELPWWLGVGALLAGGLGILAVAGFVLRAGRARSDV
jgi:hypothetical protein